MHGVKQLRSAFETAAREVRATLLSEFLFETSALGMQLESADDGNNAIVAAWHSQQAATRCWTVRRGDVVSLRRQAARTLGMRRDSVCVCCPCQVYKVGDTVVFNQPFHDIIERYERARRAASPVRL
jgi:hypothetical protein